jgi:hypothetical protein
MIVLLVLLVIGVLLYLFWVQRTTTLTRQCRWREDRRFDHDDRRLFRCLACNAKTECAVGERPRDCLAAKGDR